MTRRTPVAGRPATPGATACVAAGAGAATVAVLLLVGCSSTGSGAGLSSAVVTQATSTTTSGSGSGTASSTGSASTSPSGSGRAGATTGTDLADGRYPAYFTKVDATRRLLTVDVVQFFTGHAAATAAAGDHAGETPPPNDYYIRNSNKRLRTLAVAAGAPVTVNVLSAADSGDATKDTAVTLATLASYPTLKYSLFWVTVKDGVVSKVAEQFLP